MLGRLDNYTGIGVFLFGGGITRRAQGTPHIKLSRGHVQVQESRFQEFKSQLIISPLQENAVGLPLIIVCIFEYLAFCIVYYGSLFGGAHP